MKTYICEICGDAYLCEEKPKNCPFCGARASFMKEGSAAVPIINNKIEVGELSKKNLMETLGLEIEANNIYLCMAGKAKSYEVKVMYKRLAKVELEHASIVCKILKIKMPENGGELCSDDEAENFIKTIALEEHATSVYARFAKEATEVDLRIMFTALTQAEEDHISLIKKYLK